MFLQNILEALDEDGNGQISKEEFVNNALEIEFINQILTMKAEEATDEEAEQKILFGLR